MAKHRLLIKSAKQVVQVVNDGARVLRGKDMRRVAVIEADEDGIDGLSVVVDGEGRICAIGHDKDIHERYNESQFHNVVDAAGKCLVPGLVDGHTHAVWAGDRVHEFAMKLAGATYMEVHKAGGGIHFTVGRVRDSSEADLYVQLKQHAVRMLAAGTTLVEVKSGYGLNVDTEMKMLAVIERAKNDRSLPIDISSTFCGAHAVPKDKTAQEATTDVLDVQLPRLRQLMETGRLHVDNIDVFCEEGVFSVDQTRRILTVGQQMGLAINFHGEELHRLNSAEMGAELGARAISHLEKISEAGIQAMSQACSIGVVLPTTAYILRLTPPPVRDMIDAGMAVALGSDFNPNAHCFAMPIVMHLACVLLHMSMEEALVAATINGAASLGRADTQGSLEVGKQADILILDAPRWEHLIYQMGSHQHVIRHVVKNGIVVHSRVES
ncbi:putative imidazolonepropionase [Lamellibrachia satsuma]|nr:putative imidazolonepropionase [Lamellibrachia satsuma]